MSNLDLDSMLEEIRNEREIVNKTLKVPSLVELIRISIDRKNWHLRTPYQKWCYMYGIGKMFTWPTGFTLYESDHHSIRIRSYILILCLFAYMGLSLFTTIYYTVQGEFTKGLPCTCLLGIGLSLSPLAITQVTKLRFHMYFLVSYGGHYVYRDVHENTKHNKMCSEQIDSSIRAFFTKIVIMAFFFALTQVGPTYQFIAYGIKTTLTDLKFPFIDEDSDAEFMGNVYFQGMAFAFAGPAYMGLEVAMQLSNDLASIAPKVVQLELEELAELIQNNSTKEKMYPIFRNIVKRSLNSDNIITSGSYVLYYRTLMTPIAFTYAIAMSVFCQYQLNYLAGYGIALLSWVQLYYICELSQDIEDNGYLEVYYDFEWYKMPVAFQKDFILLINRKQNGAKFTVGPFGTINRELFKNITSKIYTLIMFLLNVYK